MKFRAILIISSILIPVYSYSQVMLKDTAKSTGKQASVKTSVNIIAPPTPGLKTRFNSISDWLTAIVNGNQPKKSINQYDIALFEVPGAYNLSLTGVNTYKEGINLQSTRIDYTPREMYCDLPPAYYQSLSREQLLAKIVAEIKSFTATPAFTNSFLAQGNLVLESSGEVIWAKK